MKKSVSFHEFSQPSTIFNILSLFVSIIRDYYADSVYGWNNFASVFAEWRMMQNYVILLIGSINPSPSDSFVKKILTSKIWKSSLKKLVGKPELDKIDSSATLKTKLLPYFKDKAYLILDSLLKLLCKFYYELKIKINKKTCSLYCLLISEKLWVTIFPVTAKMTIMISLQKYGTALCGDCKTTRIISYKKRC